MTSKDVIEHTHMCASCGRLLGISRKVRKDKDGHHIGFRFSSRCTMRRKGRNPWTVLYCQHFVQMEEQRTLMQWTRMTVPLAKKEETEPVNPGVLDSEDAEKPKKRDR